MNNYKAVLIVEDDEILANSLGRSFERRGYSAKIANNVKEAQLVLKSFHPSYAVIDLKLTAESGLDMIKYLHAFDKQIKIVMLTGYASITTTIEAIKAGACYYLAKPANVDMIIAAFHDEISTTTNHKKTSIKNLEWEHIHHILVETDFNISKAARILGMHRRTLARKLEKRHITS